MGRIIALTMLVCSGAHADEAYNSWLPDLATSDAFEYDIEALATNLALELGRSRIDFSIGNALELPEPEPPGGFYFDEATLLTDEFSGFEVDTGEERMFSLEFSFRW